MTDTKLFAKSPDEPNDNEELEDDKELEDEDEEEEEDEAKTESGVRDESQFHTGAAQAGQPFGTQPVQGRRGGGENRGITANIMRSINPPPLPLIPHEDHVRILVAEAQADEEFKFAANRAQVERVGEKQRLISEVSAAANQAIFYPQVDFSGNAKIREAAAAVKVDPKAVRADIDAHRQARANREKIRQPAQQGAVSQIVGTGAGGDAESQQAHVARTPLTGTEKRRQDTALANREP
jgi:hypothetical protein